MKLRYKRTYDGVLATPMGIADVAVGEMCWAIGRGTAYAAVFLLVTRGLGAVTGRPILLSRWSLAAFPAAILVCAAFSAVAMLLVTMAKSWRDIDLVTGLFVLPMFLFGGTFVPLTEFPAPAQWLISALPLYHAAALLRQLTTGAVEPSIWGHLAYLVLAGAVALTLALRRLERQLVI